MLQKLTAPGTDYPKAFVDEFEIFHKELKEFFNASGVVERLEKLANQDGDSGANAANAFLRAKANADDQTRRFKRSSKRCNYYTSRELPSLDRSRVGTSKTCPFDNSGDWRKYPWKTTRSSYSLDAQPSRRGKRNTKAKLHERGG